MWQQAWPTVIAMMSYTIMQFVDAMMVARISPAAVAAQGNGGIWSWCLLAALVGVVSLVNTFAAQNMGAGRPFEAARYAWAGIWIAIGSWAVVMVPWALALPTVFGWMGHDPDVERMEISYGQILAFSSVIPLIGKALSGFFFGIHRPRVIAIAAVVGNIANLIVAYAFILGPEGIPELGLPGVWFVPKLGVLGAAIASIAGTTVELCVPVFIVCRPAFAREFHFFGAWRPAWGPIKDLIRIGWPAALQSLNEMVTWALFMSVLVGRFGTVELAAGWAALRYMHLSFMPAIGFGTACAALVGRAIGAGDHDRAALFARTAVRMALGYMLAWGILMIVFRREMIGVFADAPGEDAEVLERIIHVGSRVMICAAIFQVFDAIGIVFSGALRGAGDTVWPAVVTVFWSWSLIVGLGWYFVEFHPQWGSIGPWIGASLYISAIGLTLWWRFHRGHWRTIQLVRPTSVD
ncbi:MAG: MATE family efflux transporter [Planctomycetota bacterium]|nr:MATE family efflux transporter [Planctomycetota bacterium]